MKTKMKSLFVAIISVSALFAGINTVSAQPLKFRNAMSGNAPDKALIETEARNEVRHQHRNAGGSPRTVRNRDVSESKWTGPKAGAENTLTRVGPRSRNNSSPRFTRVPEREVSESDAAPARRSFPRARAVAPRR